MLVGRGRGRVVVSAGKKGQMRCNSPVAPGGDRIALDQSCAAAGRRDKESRRHAGARADIISIGPSPHRGCVTGHAARAGGTRQMMGPGARRGACVAAGGWRCPHPFRPHSICVCVPAATCNQTTCRAARRPPRLTPAPPTPSPLSVLTGPHARAKPSQAKPSRAGALGLDST